MYKKIILVSLDTLRSDGLVSNPNPLWPSKYRVRRELRSTLLDEVIAKSAYFPNCISAAPYTSASHASFFTGLWPLNHGVFEFFNRKLHKDTIFTVGKQLGYRTVFKVDFPIILGEHLGFDRSIDEYLVEEDELFLDAVRKPEKILAFAHFGGIHIPYGYHNLRFGGEAYQAKVGQLEEEIGLPYTLPGDQLIETFRDRADLELLHRYKCIVQHYYSNAEYDALFQLYLDGVDHFLLNRFESFLAELVRVADEGNALLVIFADHGEEYDADSYGHHNSLNEGVLRVPLVVYGKDVPDGVFPQRVRSIDLVPTLLERLSVPTALGLLDGESLANSVWQSQAPADRNCFAQAYTSDTAEFVAHQAHLLRTGRHSPTLRHVRYKEAIYEGSFKLVRQHYEYSEAGGIFGLREAAKADLLYATGDGGGWVRTEGMEHIGARLVAGLDKYNQLHPGDTPGIDVNASVRQSLRNMGYRV